MPQDEINALLVEPRPQRRHGRAAEGRRPVRVRARRRGGRGARAGRASTFEVVPGVTAGVAAPAYAGIPVTHRDEASAVAFVTGHEDPAKDESALDWEALARFPGTLVFYMGVRRLPQIAERLIAAGRAGGRARGRRRARHAARASARSRRRWPSSPRRVAAAGITPPAITLVGPVARHRDGLAWLERRPLHGRRVVVTRARAQASGLAATLRDLGADVVEAPTIRIEPRPVEAELDRATTSSASRARTARACSSTPSPSGARTRARWPARRWPRSGRAPPASSARAASSRM